MTTLKRMTSMVSAFSYIVLFLCLFNIPKTAAQDVYLCVWRNPERTMARIFPEAKDYKTITLEISPAQRKTIETELGFPLLPGQEKQFLYYDMLGVDGVSVGKIIAASQKGEYGIVEFVFGLDVDQTLKNIYIQRARERDQTFKKREFLDLFLGLKLTDADQVKQRYTGSETPGTTAVITGIAKELVALKHLSEISESTKNGK
ncbi:hypothetical protein K8T06_15440 [bacterium]|nr:hypothetical protein [bacterium]